MIFEKNVKNQIFGTKFKSDIYSSLGNQPKYDSYVLLMADSDQNLSSHASYTKKKEYSGPIPVSQDLFYES